MQSEGNAHSPLSLTLWFLGLALVPAFFGFVLGLHAGDFQLSNRSAGVFLLAIVLACVCEIVDESGGNGA